MHFAAKIADIPHWGKKLVTVNGTEVLLVNIKGNVHAMEPECPHQGAPLSGALIKDPDHITCQRHGYRFNLHDGGCENFPEYSLKIYPVRIEGDDVLVDLA